MVGSSEKDKDRKKIEKPPKGSKEEKETRKDNKPIDKDVNGVCYFRESCETTRFSRPRKKRSWRSIRTNYLGTSIAHIPSSDEVSVECVQSDSRTKYREKRKKEEPPELKTRGETKLHPVNLPP